MFESHRRGIDLFEEIGRIFQDVRQDLVTLLDVFLVDGVSHSWCAQHISQVSPQCGVIHDALLVALQKAVL